VRFTSPAAVRPGPAAVDVIMKTHGPAGKVRLRLSGSPLPYAATRKAAAATGQASLRILHADRSRPVACCTVALVALLLVSLLLLFTVRGPLRSPQLRDRQWSSLKGLQPPKCCTHARSRCEFPACASERAPVFAARPTPLRVGFVAYATGPYNAFLEDLWVSIERFAFTEPVRTAEVHLFAFTDAADNSSFLHHPRVHKMQQERLGWPWDSLGRHFLYLNHSSWFEGEGMEYMLAVDSDAVFVAGFGEEVLGETIASTHPTQFGSPPATFDYDRRLCARSGRPYSTAYLGPAEGACYYAGGLFGGSIAGFIRLLRETTAMARTDLAQQPPRVALWHDESYLNALWAREPPAVILGPQLIYPEAPWDAWLHWTDNPRGHLWRHMRSAGCRPVLLNLGVRKHVNANVAAFQPGSATMPALLAPHNRPVPYLPPPEPAEAHC